MKILYESSCSLEFLTDLNRKISFLFKFHSPQSLSVSSAFSTRKITFSLLCLGVFHHFTVGWPFLMAKMLSNGVGKAINLFNHEENLLISLSWPVSISSVNRNKPGGRYILRLFKI